MGHLSSPVIRGNGFAVAGFVLGLLGLVLAVIPFLGLIALPLVIPGLVFGGIGLARSLRRHAPRLSLAAAGIMLSLIGFVVCLIWLAGIMHDMSNLGRVAIVHYQVTGNAPTTTITYSAFGDGGSATDQQTVHTLPWSKDVKINGSLKGSSLITTIGKSGGSVTCTVVVNGKETRRASASGPFAVASCNGF